MIPILTCSVYDVAKQLVTIPTGPVYLPNGELFNKTQNSTKLDFANAQSRCVVVEHLFNR